MTLVQFQLYLILILCKVLKLFFKAKIKKERKENHALLQSKNQKVKKENKIIKAWKQSISACAFLKFQMAYLSLYLTFCVVLHQMQLS